MKGGIFGPMKEVGNPYVEPKSVGGQGPLFGEISTIVNGSATDVQGLFGEPMIIGGAPVLLADFSNVADVTHDELQRHYNGPRRNQLISAVKASCLSVNSAVGVEPAKLPKHLLQRGDTCQTMAVVNGLSLVGGAGFFDRGLAGGGDIYTFIERCRANVRSRGLNDYLYLNIIEELKRQGYHFSYDVIPNNPIKLARALWSRDKQFLLCTKQGVNSKGHTVALLPCKNANSDEYLRTVDSLRESPYSLSVEDFIRLVIEGPSDFTLVSL
ncbi:MAG: hypothetical protein WCT53_03040 [Candidatus Gracilibacteria bacterium]